MQSTRRKIIALMGLALAFALSSGGALAQSLSISVNTSPWLPAFQELVRVYEEQTGVDITIHAFPYDQMIEKERNAASVAESEFDIITINEIGVAFFYSGGFVTPFKEIDPNWKPDPAIISYDGIWRFNEQTGFVSEDGEVYALPINGNVQLFFYRRDLYEQAGLKPPQTWDDVVAAAQKLADPRRGLYGYAVRGQKASSSVSSDWYSFLRGFGGDIFVDPPRDWSVALLSPEAKAALEFYVKLAREYSPPNAPNVGQAEQIALMTSGRLVQTILFAAAAADMDNPTKSVVVGQVDYVKVPAPVGGQHASNSGVLVMAIPHNIPMERKKLALDFLTWATSFEAQVLFTRHGGVPVRSDIAAEFEGDPRYRFLKALEDTAPHIKPRPRIPEMVQLDQVYEHWLNEAVAGRVSVEETLTRMAEETSRIMREAGYDAPVVRY